MSYLISGQFCSNYVGLIARYHRLGNKEELAKDIPAVTKREFTPYTWHGITANSKALMHQLYFLLTQSSPDRHFLPWQ